jgi:hypothetical protein
MGRPGSPASIALDRDHSSTAAMIAPNSVTFSGRYLGRIEWLQSDWLLEEQVAGFRSADAC